VTAQMNALAGFGQYLSLFLLVLVLLWWWTHWRRARTQKARGTTVSD
jgi:cbb3-type cytochrome oxidase subunit 3